MHPDSVTLARLASQRNHERAKEYEGVIEALMGVLDDLTSPLYSLVDHEERHEWLRSTPEWKAAAHVLGWDVDWDALAEARLGQ